MISHRLISSINTCIKVKSTLFQLIHLFLNQKLVYIYNHILYRPNLFPLEFLVLLSDKEMKESHTVFLYPPHL